MISKIVCRASRQLRQLAATGPFVTQFEEATPKLPRCLLPGLLSFAFLAATPTASFAQSLGTTAQPDDASTFVKRPDARHLVSARLPPYRAIGRLTGPMGCTGVIVMRPRIVLTAAHCVVGITSPPSSSRLVFRPAYEGGVSLGIFEGRVVTIGSTRQWQVQSVHDASQDWAILVLNKEPVGIRPLGIAAYTPQELQSMHGRILLPSYSRDMARGEALSVDTSCSIEGLKWEVLLHDCAAGVGSPGAPLLVRDRDCYRIVGIHSGAMLVDNHRNPPMRLVGNSAIGAWNFADQVHAIARRLDADEGIASAEMRPSNACSFDMASHRVRPEESQDPHGADSVSQIRRAWRTTDASSIEGQGRQP